MLEGLSEEQKKALVIADNQLALNAGWDMDLLKGEIIDLGESDFDMDLLGFDGGFLDDLLNGVEDESEIEDMLAEDEELAKISIKCKPDDLTHMLNQLDDVIAKFSGASVWCDE